MPRAVLRPVAGLFPALCTSVFLSGAVPARAIPAEETSERKTIVEHAKKPGLWALWKTRWVLGTKHYTPSEKESVFFERLSPDEKITGDPLMLRDYSITGKVGKFVGWFGIVRGVEESRETDATELLVEMKYFDGHTDLHIMAVSFNGGGDFKAILSGTDHGIKLLSLVKVYGKVKKEVELVPHLEAGYVRQWDWGAFTFIMAYGKQKGNTAWRKLNKVPLDNIYHPRPNQAYYENRLGNRPATSIK